MPKFKQTFPRIYVLKVTSKIVLQGFDHAPALLYSHKVLTYNIF